MNSFTKPDTSARLRTDSDRLWTSMMEMARLGATIKGGVNRQALTDLDRQGRDLFIEWCRAEGCTIRVDRIGNIFARREGSDLDAKTVMAGSHLDSQPTGGKYDGVFGVLASLEVIRTLNQHDIKTRAPVEIAAWTNEEGCRFPPCMMGSGVFAGVLDFDEMMARRDADNVTASDALDAIGYRGNDPVSTDEIAAYFEPHIEQGPILEDTETTIGVVMGGLGQQWFDLTLTGLEAHAGPTPMNLRRDAMMGAAEVTQALNRIANAHQPHGRGTVGYMALHPGSRNVIPGQVKMTLDMRHWEPDELNAMSQAVSDAIAEICQRHGLEHELTPTANFAPEHFDAGCIGAVRRAAKALGLSHRDIISGAGHDAMFIGRVAPAAMIFIPCKDGISHNEAESATPEHVHAGANVLLHAVLEAAGVEEAS
ncbi:Zn-dependent hydrolase [Halomonas sp. PAMB 3232]|uniref:Zn-dependent hydrolase n=1 Tax=Halomonas sp. PAMB 3232 TaxID=3075221 RepID=UPI00289FA4FA|nr:Zn-dependent hydrolase [Halomonas sp. PAMB 3232]WNL38628.1 Zn-dependent hydrolase [Halomonas sp. PAMB 3232]